MITLTPRNQLGGIQLTVRNGGLRQWIMPVNQEEEETNPLAPQIQPASVSAPMGYVTKPAAKTPSTGLQTANKTGTILPSTDDPESYVRGLNAVTEQSQPTRSNELATSLSNMATASTARNNRQTGLRFQSLLGGQTVKGVSAKATPTDTAWFNVMSDAEKTRAAQTKNPVERGAYINSLNLNDRAINNLRQQQDNAAKELETKQLRKSDNPAGAAIAAYVSADNQKEKREAYQRLAYLGLPLRKYASEEELTRLDERQKSVISKLAQAGDYQAVADYYDNIEYKLKAESRETLVEKSKALGREHPVWSVVPEGASNSFNGIGPMLDGVYSKLKEGLTGEWTPIDPNSHIYDLVASSQAIQEGANERIAGIENPALRESAKVARSGASSALTNILQMLAGGAIGLEGEALSNFTLGVMGTSAAGQSLYRDLKDGKTSEEAMTNAIATGVIETLTEKVSLDRLIKELPSLRGDNAAELAKAFWDVVKWQAPIEGLEEIAGNVLDQTWDILYSGEDSEYSKRTQAVLAQRIKNGGENYRPTEQDVQSAREQAFMDLFVTQSAEAFASAVFSSFLMVGAPATFNGVTGRITTNKAGNSLKYNHLTLNEIAKGDMFPGTKAAEIAGQLRSVYDEKGEKSVPSNQLGKLAAANNALLINALDQMSASDNPQVASYANDLLENPHKIANRYLKASELEKILNIKRANAVNAADMPVTASEETFANAADRERTQTANPGAVTLTAAEQVIMDSYESIDLKAVQKRASVMDKIISGENVSMREFKAIKPQSETTREIFAKLTGVAIPDGLTGKALLNEYQRGSKTNTDAVAREARDEINAEHAAEKIPVLSVRTPSVAIDSDTGRQQFPAVNAYLDAQKSADNSQSQPETTPWRPEDNGWDTFIQDFQRQFGLLSADGQTIPSMSEFASAYQSRFPNASNEEITRQYRKFLQENRSVLLDGESTSFEKFRQILSTRNPNLTEDVIRNIWDKTVDEYERTGEDPVARMSEENERKQAEEEEARKRADDEKRKAKNRGKTSVAPNQYIDYHWAVVPAESLIISNDEYGNRNPNYPRELQPRDRSRVGSQLDISNIAKRLDPYRMTMRETGQDGAPIVNQNGVVISGNGRSAAVLSAYQNQYESAQKYADYIRSHAEDYGLDPAQFPENPVLVRVADNVQDEAKLARDLNVSQTAAYSPMETAKADAEKIEDILEFLDPDKRGDLTVAKNRPFVAAFLASVPQSQRSALMDERGNLNIPGLARMKNALLAYAYEDTALISQFTESLDQDGMKRTANALEQVAPEIAQLKFDMKSGNAYNVPVVQTILDALGLYKESRLNGQTVSEIVDNASTDTNYGPNETLVAEAIEYYNRKSATGAYEFFHSLVEAIRDFGSPDQYSMLGGTENDATIESALRKAAEIANEREKGKLNLQLGEGQFGGQSLSTGEDSGGGSQSESGGQDGSGNRGGVSEDVGAGVSQADRAKFSDAAQRFIKSYDSDSLHEMWRKSVPSKLEAYIWETVQDRGGNDYGIKSIDSIREMTAEEKRKSHIPDIDPALEITWTSEQDYGGRNNPRVHIATIDVGMDAFPRFTEEDENADRTIKFKETPDEFDDFWDTKPASETSASLAMDAERNPTLTESVPGASSESGLPEGVGAASYAFHNDATAAQLESLTAQYGHVKGEQGRRQLDNASQEKGVYINEIPAQTNDETYVGRNVVTQLSAPGIAKERISDYEEGVVSGYFDHAPLTHKEALEKAGAAMKRLGGLEKSQKYLENKVSRNQFLTEEDIALFQKTLVGLSHTDMSTQDYIQFAADFNSLASYYGKALGLMNLLRKIDPDIQIHEAQRATQKLNEDFAEKGRAKAKNKNVSENEKAEQAVEEAREDTLDDLEHPENAQRKQRKRNAQKRRGKGAKAEQAVEENRDHGFPVPYWMDDAGKIVAGILKQNVEKATESVPQKPHERRVVKTVIQDILKFADSYGIPQLPESPSQNRTEIDRIRDFFANQEKYQEAWKSAQDTLRVKYERDGNTEKLDALEGFLNGTLDAEGVLRPRLNTDINAALRDIGVKMSEIIRQGNPQKADVAKRISDMLIQQYGISNEAAQRAAQIVVERFNQQVAQRAQETLEKMFREENGSKFNTANQDRILKQFSDLANMGAFTSADYQAQASAKIFGYDYIKIDPALIQEFRDAETDEQKDAVIGKIQQNVADQIPATLGEKITALRYMGMLGSLKTIVSRNMGGNLFFQPAVDAKNAIAAAMESFAYNQGWIERKTRAVTFDGKTYAAFRADYDNSAIRETILNGTKYLDEKPTNNFIKGVQKRRQIFGRNNDALSKTVGRGLEWTRNAITNTMDLGDSIFAKHTYAVAAARYLKAQGVASFDAATPEQLTAAREIAIKEAQEATYRDSSEIAEAFARLRYNGENKWLRFASAVGEGVLPFRKTPANITLRAFEYSPLGLVKSGVDLATAKYGSNRMSGNDIINELAKGLSGSALFLIGMFLRRIGWLTGMGPSDKKEKAFNELQGVQRYSFKIGAPISQKERYFDVSWMAPEAIPMFLGANAVDMFDTFMSAKADGTIDSDDVASVVSGVASLAASGIDPIIQMSMLQGVNNALKDAANYGDDGYAIDRFIGGALWSYFTQGAVPQVIQQIPRALHNNRQITFVDRNSGLTSETQRVLGKIPYLTFLTDDKMDYLDLWGRTRQNYESEASNVAAQFLSPTYQSIYEPYAGTELDSTNVDAMLWDLYQRTGDKAVLPSGTQSYFTLGGQRTNLSKAEYIQYVTVKGNTSLGILQKLTENKSFSALTDAQKADAISFVYSYANEMGKAEATKSRDVNFVPSKRNLTAMSLDADNAVSLDDFAVAYAIQKSVPANVTGKDGKAIEAKVKKNGKNAGSSGSHAIETALRIRKSLNLNNAQYQQLFEALDVAESVRGLSAESLENKLNAIKRKEGNAS